MGLDTEGWTGASPDARDADTAGIHIPASPWSMAIRLAQWAAAGAAAVALALPISGSSAGRSTVITLTGVLVVALAAASFGGAAVAGWRSGSILGGPSRTFAWLLFAVAYAGVAAVVVLHRVGAPGGSGDPDGSGAASSLGTSALVPCGSLAAASLLQAAAIWVLLRGRAPRWAPATGWDGPVVALGAAALGTGALELALRAAEPRGGVSSPALVLAMAGTVLFVTALTAVAVAAPGPRSQLSWLAAGITIVLAADLAALAHRDSPALLIIGTDDATARLVRFTAVLGYAVLSFAPAAVVAGRRVDRRLRPGTTSAFTPSSALVASSVIVVAAAVIRPDVPRAAAALALACLVFALIRTRRRLRAVQSRGRPDPRPRTDDLTGLANRRALAEALAGDTRPADGGTGDTGWPGWAGWADEIALLLVDLDRFKDVNEALGHTNGDLLLTEVGARLRTALRPTQMLARLGGDEFAVVMPAADPKTAVRVAEALRESLAEPFEIDGSRLHVQASVGVATCHPGSGEPTDLLRQADVAMYQAKALGTGIEVYDPSRDDAGSQRLRRTDELRDALERGDLEVHVQPQVDLRTGLICGGEALARWRHPVDGVLLPDSFLPLAQHTGLMRPVAALLLDRALAACGTWWAPGFHVPISVNVGADDLRDPELPLRVVKLLNQHGLPPAALCVEITEQALLTDLPAAAALLARWRSDGIAVSIDDFGTGYSSLSYLRELPVDEVKLDRAFVADVARPTTMTIVRHTVAMAHGLWARTVAEGIEDEATARIIADLGADVGQGLYFGAAMTPAEFVTRLQAQ